MGHAEAWLANYQLPTRIASAIGHVIAGNPIAPLTPALPAEPLDPRFRRYDWQSWQEFERYFEDARRRLRP